MNPFQHAELSTYVTERITDKTKVKQLLSIAAGIAIAFNLALPASDGTSGQQVYVDQISSQVTTAVSAFNEGTTISLDLATEVARGFWLKRFGMAYPINPIPLVDDEETHFLGLVTGTGHLIAPEVMELCNQESTLLIFAINKIRAK